MGDRQVLPESRLLAIEIKKNPAIANIKAQSRNPVIK
jgi:hypothetical protein